MTQEFISFMQQPLELLIFTTPYVFVPPTGISTKDPGVAARLGGVGTCSPSFARHSMLKNRLFEDVGPEGAEEEITVPKGEMVSLQRELSRAKAEKRRIQVKQVVRELGHVAGGASKAAAAMNGKGFVPDCVACNGVGCAICKSSVEELRARVADLEKQLVERGPVPPAGPHTGNPRNSGSARIEELEKRCEKLAQQIRDLGHVPLD